MVHIRRIATVAVAAALAFAAPPVADVVAAQSALERTPNLSGDWLGAPGTLQFNFVHRFGVTDAPQRKVLDRKSLV